MNIKVKCTYCGGTGEKGIDPSKPCPVCQGTGQSTVQVLDKK